MVNAYLLKILIVDHDEVGEEDIKTLVEDVKYPNRCLSPTVLSIVGKDVGEFDDDHPLNDTRTIPDEVKRLFG
jgi:hypothetical protein